MSLVDSDPKITSSAITTEVGQVPMNTETLEEKAIDDTVECDSCRGSLNPQEEEKVKKQDHAMILQTNEA